MLVGSGVRVGVGGTGVSVGNAGVTVGAIRVSIGKGVAAGVGIRVGSGAGLIIRARPAQRQMNRVQLLSSPSPYFCRRITMVVKFLGLFAEN